MVCQGLLGLEGGTGWIGGTVRKPCPSSPSRRSYLSCLLQSDHQRGAPIQAPRFLARVVVFGPLLAVADRLEPIGGDAPADQVILHGGGAAIAQRAGVICRAPGLPVCL